MGFFIPYSSLKNLKEYKYQSEDRSLISKHILKPFWYKFVQIFPLWMAPNVVTLLGFCFILLNLITVFYYDPYLVSNEPTWTYFSYAIGLFMYQTFDACDGTHARRTGQSGPLGELFDHCVDAVNTTLSVIIFGSVAGFGYSWLLIVSQFATLCNFYLSTWEEFHTHKLFLSEISGPVEGILSVIGLFSLTGIFGPKLWELELLNFNFALIGLDIDYTLNFTKAYVLLGTVGLYFNIDSARHNVKKYYMETNEKSKYQASLKGLLPFFGYYATVFALLWSNPLIIQNYCLPFILTVGLTTAFSVGRIIVAHLTIQNFPYLTPSSFIPVAEFFIFNILKHLGYNPDLVTGYLIWAGFGLSLGLYSMFVVEIIYEITTYLDIYALSIKHPKTA